VILVLGKVKGLAPSSSSTKVMDVPNSVGEKGLVGVVGKWNVEIGDSGSDTMGDALVGDTAGETIGVTTLGRMGDGVDLVCDEADKNVGDGMGNDIDCVGDDTLDGNDIGCDTGNGVDVTNGNTGETDVGDITMGDIAVPETIGDVVVGNVIGNGTVVGNTAGITKGDIVGNVVDGTVGNTVDNVVGDAAGEDIRTLRDLEPIIKF
jgi:hypothetical protein